MNAVSMKPANTPWKSPLFPSLSMAELLGPAAQPRSLQAPEQSFVVPGTWDEFEAPAARSHSSGSVHLNPPASGDVYAHIEKLFGKNSVEMPDRGPWDKHIKVVNDPRVGKAFEFRLNRDKDKDPLGHSGRQRAEIKVGPHAPDRLKATQGESFSYKWKFKLDDDMRVSKSFTHFFQLKGSGGPDDSMPLVTISGKKTSGGDKLQVNHSDGGKGQVLAEADLSKLKGKWIEAEVFVNHSKNGQLRMNLKTLDGKSVLKVNESNIDMIRDVKEVRPKWGFYRSLADKEQLKPGDTTVRFADFSVTPHGKGGKPVVDKPTGGSGHPSAAKFPSGVMRMLDKQTGIDNPEVWDNILKLTNKSEQDNLRWDKYYNYAEKLSYDAHMRGVTTSIWGFTTRHGEHDGDAIPLFKEYERLGGKEDLMALKNKDDKLIQTLRGMGNDPIWKKAVWNRFSQTYIADTMKTLRDRGFSKPSPLTVAALLDCALNQGSTGNKGMFWCVDKVPSHIRNEKEFLARFLDEREKVVGTNGFNSPPINGKNRVNQYRELLKKGAMSLVNSDGLIKNATDWVMK